MVELRCFGHLNIDASENACIITGDREAGQQAHTLRLAQGHNFVRLDTAGDCDFAEDFSVKSLYSVL